MKGVRSKVASMLAAFSSGANPGGSLVVDVTTLHPDSLEPFDPLGRMGVMARGTLGVAGLFGPGVSGATGALNTLVGVPRAEG